MRLEPEVKVIDTEQGSAWIMDSLLDDVSLDFIDDVRCSLDLEKKRPTVDRRFFADGSTLPERPGDNVSEEEKKRPVASLLEGAIQRGLKINSNGTSPFCHVFRYQRFLEYTKVGSNLDPHTDGTKKCDDTSCTSTHTMLLYLSDCDQGGETVLLEDCQSCRYDSQESWIYPAQPKRGRILLFPHATPHAGNTVVDVPKICLRAEVSLQLD